MIKRFGSIACLLISALSVEAQWDVVLTHQASYVGRDVNLTLHKRWKKHTLGGGIKYHRNSRVHDLKEAHLFKRRLYANHWSQRLGAILRYSYRLPFQTDILESQLFYQIQATRAEVIGDRFYLDIVQDGVQIYQYVRSFEPVVSVVEQHAGLNVNIALTERLFIHQRAGLGVATFHQLSHSQASRSDKADLAYTFAVGLLYRFEK